MNEPLQVRITTDNLMRLLEGQPDVIARLESMACEKIAEEISRKATTKDLKALTDAALKNVMADLTRSVRDPNKWPFELQTAIKSMIMSHLKDQRVAMINEFRDEVNKLVNEAVTAAKISLETQANEMFVQLRGNMADVARESFFEVLKEARGA